MVYLFTVHAYGTWHPDRPQGSVHWKRGYQKTNAELAAKYRMRQREDSADFSDAVQRQLIDRFLEAADHQQRTLYMIATDKSHVHLLCGWRDIVGAMKVLSELKRSVSIRLRHDVEQRAWFAKKGHLRRVQDRKHFDHLRKVYLPSHAGWKWDAERGMWLEKV